MLMAAIAGGGLLRDERSADDHVSAPRTAGDCLRAAVDADASTRAYGIDGAPVRLSRGSGPTGMARISDCDHRRRPGLVGTSGSGRPGFKELISRVCIGEVGAIFGLE